MRKPCLTPMCGEAAVIRRSRCRACQRYWDAARYNHPAYRAQPTPHGRTCVLRIAANCTGTADITWDHINGDATDHRPSNLQPACRRCNSKKKNANWR